MSYEEKRQVDQRRENYKNRKQKHDKENLKKNIGVKFNTLMIGCLDILEQVFGDELWGHGLNVKDLSVEQRSNREKWKGARDRILDLGNEQRFNALKEIDCYNVEYQKKKYNFIFKGNQK